VSKKEASVRIDGRYGEGGGSILRLATALSAITGNTVVVDNIRSNRSRPGLAPQHLTGLKALARLFSARTQGLSLGSTKVKFVPRSPRGGQLSVDVGTAGSIGLVLQTLMIVVPFVGEPTEISLTGGTHVRWSPNIDYLERVTLPIMRRMGYRGTLSLIQPGYYPKGGGKVIFKGEPWQGLEAVSLEDFGQVESIGGISRASNLPKHVPMRQADAAKSLLSDRVEPEVFVTTERAMSPGSAITLWAETSEGCILGSSSLGEKGKPAEEVGTEAARDMKAFIDSRSPVDPFLLDQILPYASLADGKSVFESVKLTDHALTNIHVIGEFLNSQIEVEGDRGGSCRIEVYGADLEGSWNV